VIVRQVCISFFLVSVRIARRAISETHSTSWKRARPWSHGRIPANLLPSKVCKRHVTSVNCGGSVNRLTPPQFFGEVALLSPSHRRRATVTAVRRVRCLTLDCASFTRLLGPLEEILKRCARSHPALLLAGAFAHSLA